MGEILEGMKRLETEGLALQEYGDIMGNGSGKFYVLKGDDSESVPSKLQAVFRRNPALSTFTRVLGIYKK
jgi:hypothetical protein